MSKIKEQRICDLLLLYEQITNSSDFKRMLKKKERLLPLLSSHQDRRIQQLANNCPVFNEFLLAETAIEAESLASQKSLHWLNETQEALCVMLEVTFESTLDGLINDLAYKRQDQKCPFYVDPERIHIRTRPKRRH